MGWSVCAVVAVDAHVLGAPEVLSMCGCRLGGVQV